jgi:hypothetical protein
MRGGTLSVPHQDCRCAYIVRVRLAIVSSLVLGAAEGRWCPLTQEPKLLAETLIAISSPLRLSPLPAAQPARGKLPV